MIQLRSFLDGIGMPLRKHPLMGGREIDLYVLQQLVVAAGGYHRITQEKRWVEIGQHMKLREASHNAYALRQHYSKWLLQFELHLGELSLQMDSQGRAEGNSFPTQDICVPSAPAAQLHLKDSSALANPMVAGSSEPPLPSRVGTAPGDDASEMAKLTISWNSLALQVQVLLG